MGRGLAQSGYQVCAALDPSQGWTSAIITDGEWHHFVIIVSVMPQFNVKVCSLIFIHHNHLHQML